jgi:hypothetical protein
MKLLLIGIDPDINGAVAAMQVERDIANYGKYTSLQLNEKTLYYIDAFINDQASAFQPDEILITLERVHSRPTDGVKQAFSFGAINGAIKARLRDFQYQEIRPTEWQRMLPKILSDIGILRGHTVKGKSRIVCSSLLKSRKQNEIPQGEADAFCIMMCGYLRKGEEA